MFSGYDMKVWLGKVFSPVHKQLMCCALKVKRGRRRARRRNYICDRPAQFGLM